MTSQDDSDTRPVSTATATGNPNVTAENHLLLAMFQQVTGIPFLQWTLTHKVSLFSQKENALIKNSQHNPLPLMSKTLLCGAAF